MRILFFSLMTVLLILPYGTSVHAQGSTTNVFITNLSLGSKGTQVMALQKILNQDPDTRIASTGIGSPGNETNYFGALTKAAVVRFQTKYAHEVLTPAGLTWGNGYVGSYTRAKLNALSASGTVNASPSAVPSDSTPPVTTPTPTTIPSPAIPASTNVSQNPNLKNIDKFMTALDNVAAKKGLSASSIATIKEQVMKEVATTTDLHAAFLKQIQYASHQSINDGSLGGRVLAMVEQLFAKTLMPERARAATGVPFGGALLFQFFCNQSDTWLITVEPLPPSYAALLTYVPFSEAFLSYNIPFTSWLLGEYEPGAGVCIVGACPYCTYIPSEGMISPMTGSSPA